MTDNFFRINDYDPEIECTFCNFFLVLFAAIFSFSGPVFLALNTAYLINGKYFHPFVFYCHLVLHVLGLIMFMTSMLIDLLETKLSKSEENCINWCKFSFFLINFFLLLDIYRLIDNILFSFLIFEPFKIFICDI